LEFEPYDRPPETVDPTPLQVQIATSAA